MLADLRFALRSLRNSPGFATVTVLTLALGIGATVAIFSLVNTALLKPLPYAQPDRLARLYVEAPNTPNLRRARTATTEYFQLRDGLQAWQSLEAWQTGGVNFAGGAEPVRVTATRLTGGLLGTLGVAPELGRLVTPQDDEVGAPAVAVISHGLWQRAFGGDRATLGREVVINGRAHTVIGVMPESFAFPPGEADASDVWMPIQIDRCPSTITACSCLDGSNPALICPPPAQSSRPSSRAATRPGRLTAGIRSNTRSSLTTSTTRSCSPCVRRSGCYSAPCFSCC